VTTTVAAPWSDRIDLLHAREMPQKDNLCGAFWGALVLRAAGVSAWEAEPVDQDLVARLAGTVLPPGDPLEGLPPGAAPRTDYRLTLPAAPEGVSAGTAASGVRRAIERISGGRLAAVPVAGPWSEATVVDLVDVAGAAAGGAVLIANLRTGRLWGARPPAPVVLAHLLGRSVEPPPPDWDVGHFVTLASSVRGRGGILVVVRDTYSTLGWGGYHVQPPGAVAAALTRGDGHEGGVLCVQLADAAADLRSALSDRGFDLRDWNNGTPDSGEGG
jgi:hypothetical protein